MRYTESEVRRIGHAAFRAARMRNRKVCSHDKANVIETMQLWREYPDVELTHTFEDAAAMMLMRNPRQFDVIVTGNVFGNILFDVAAMLTGSIGMLPSALLASGRLGLYEPVHGTAPDIAGMDITNPLAAILSVEMMMRLPFGPARSRRPDSPRGKFGSCRWLPYCGHLPARNEKSRHARDGRSSTCRAWLMNK
jgi:3-isopropylmalate dehydrogenase